MIKDSELDTLLEIRKSQKEKNPKFIRQDIHKKKRLSPKWRKPKGLHSKIRHRFKGRGKMPSCGYKSPRKVRGLHTSGLKIINIYSLSDLKKIKNESEGIIVSKTIGIKKKLEIFKKSRELKIEVLNLNVDGHIKKFEDLLNSKKKNEVKETKKEKSPKQKEIKINNTKEKSPNKLSDQDKKELEKKEQDKILTRKS